MFASKDNFLPRVFGLKLNGRSVSVRLAPAISCFEDMNIPGADFCAINHVRAIVDYKLKEDKLVFPKLSIEIRQSCDTFTLNVLEN
jgi:hypothetical protein